MRRSGEPAARTAPLAAPHAALLAVLLATGWLAGVALQLQQPALWGNAVVLALLAAALLGAAMCWRWRGRWAGIGALVLLAALAAFATTSLRAAARLADRLDAALEGQDITVIGVVAEMSQANATGTRFVFDVESATLAGAAVRLPQRLSLGWYRERDDDAALGGADPTLRAGQRWRFVLRLRQPHGSVNPHGFDAELWMFERGLGASGSVRSAVDAAPRLLAEDSAHPVERLRQRVRDAITLRIADPVAADVLAALAVGDQGAIDRAGWELFRNTGVAHLMSISGLHVTMFAWLAGALLARLWRLHPRLPLWCATPLAARAGGLAAATAYAVLAGWGVPAQRTVAMIAVVVLLRCAGVRWPLHAVLLAAAFVVTLLDPWAVLQPGFWLSFAAVALLVAAEPVHAPLPTPLHAPVQPGGWRTRLLQSLRGGVKTQAVATIGLAPLSLVFFHQLSLVGFAANLVAIPLVTLLITPLALLGALLPPLWLLGAVLVRALAGFLQALADLPLAVWWAAAAPPWAAACGLLAGALAVLPLPWRLRACALPLLLPLLAPPLQRPADGSFDLVAADIGQGTAVLLRTRSHLLVYDSGPQTTPDSDAGARVLLPLLRARGEARIDTLLLSHRDSDHVGGAASLLAGMPVALLTSSLEDGHPLRALAPRHLRCAAGQSWQWDGVRFDMLHPLAADYAQPLKSNAMSCVLRVQDRDGASVLLTGDIEAAQEAALLQRDAAALAPLRSSVLLVPHHGSRTSSTAGFIEAVQPQVAVVQAGYRSRYGHPAPDVVARYSVRGVAVVRSDACGAWTLQPDGAAHCQRDLQRRYWHHRRPAAVP